MPLLLLLGGAAGAENEIVSEAPFIRAPQRSFSLDAPWVDERVFLGASEPVMGGAADGTPTTLPEDVDGFLVSSAGDLFWEFVHVLPRAIRLGNIVATTDVSVEIYNAFRALTRQLGVFTNNAGLGVAFLDLPALPHGYAPQTGETYTLEVTLVGPAAVDTTLDYFFSLGGFTIRQPISLVRAVVFPWRPLQPIRERLSFRTAVSEHKDGTERRQALRLAPRQSFEMDFDLDDGEQRQRVENVLHGWTHFGMPVWPEMVSLTAPAAAGSTTLSVDADAAYADLRVGGAVLLWQDDDTYETGLVASVGAGVVEVSSAIANSYAAGSKVAPVRVAIVESAGSQQHPVALEVYSVRFVVNENDRDLSDVSGFDSYGGKVLLDGNVVGGALSRSVDRRVFLVDGDTGPVTAWSPWRSARPARTWTFRPTSRAALWAMRGLLHALRGRAISLYAATSFHELTPTRDLSSGSTSLYVSNVGYSRYVAAMEPRNVVRLTLSDGSTIAREVTAASELSASEEQLTVSPAWAADVDRADIERVEYLEKVRGDSDDLQITHEDALGNAECAMPIRGVFE